MDLVTRHEISDGQIRQLMELYREEWWSNSRTEAEVRRMLKGSDILFAVTERGSKDLIAFARVLTDDVYFALVFDVIVGSEHRGGGVGRSLMDAIVAHPRIQGVRSIELVCQPELVEFYKKWGFTNEVGRSLLMRRTGDDSLAGG